METLNKIETTFSRDDYMQKRVTHRQYYTQFVTPRIKQMVLDRFGLNLLVASKDEHLSDISLKDWDSLAGVTDRRWPYNRYVVGTTQMGVGYPNHTLRIEDGSLASAVCTLKEAARQLIDEVQA